VCEVEIGKGDNSIEQTKIKAGLGIPDDEAKAVCGSVGVPDNIHTTVHPELCYQ